MNKTLDHDEKNSEIHSIIIYFHPITDEKSNNQFYSQALQELLKCIIDKVSVVILLVFF